MRIVLDAMGSDACPEPEVQAAVQLVQLFPEELILVGPEDQLKPRLGALTQDPSLLGRIKIIHAPETITMEDKGIALALKAKRKNAKNSLAVGMDLVKNGEADAFVTAGNTGGAMATAFFRLGTIPGAERAALCGIFPVKNGQCLVLDIGANPDCKPEHLLQFAVMGSVYAERVRGIPKPRVALISNGEEAGKGNELVKATYPLLAASSLNFIGNVEGKELFGGEADVVVCDGFTGNILLKSSEAVASFLLSIVKDKIEHGPLQAKVGGLLVRPTLRSIKKIMDPSEIGAAPLLGIDGLVFIGHGRSDATAMVSAVRTARQAVEAELLKGLRTSIQEQLANVQKLQTQEAS